MATHGSIASISIGGVEFPASGTVSRPLAVNTTDYTGPGWLHHFKRNQAAKRNEGVYYATGTVELDRESLEELQDILNEWPDPEWVPHHPEKPEGFVRIFYPHQTHTRLIFCGVWDDNHTDVPPATRRKAERLWEANHG